MKPIANRKIDTVLREKTLERTPEQKQIKNRAIYESILRCNSLDLAKDVARAAIIESKADRL